MKTKKMTQRRNKALAIYTLSMTVFVAIYSTITFIQYV